MFPIAHVQVKFCGYEIGSSSFDPSKETILYRLEQGGRERYWRSRSLSVSRAFAKLQVGDVVEISRKGEGVNTRYTVEKVG